MHARVQDLTLARVPEGFRGRNKILVQLWYLVQGLFFKLSPHAFNGWRCVLLRAFGSRIGRNVRIRPSATITYPWNVTIGDNSYIGDEVVIYSLGQVSIGDHVSISYRAFLCTGTHDHNDVNFPLVIKAISVSSEAWIGADAFLAPGVNVGIGAVLGARSTALSDIPDYDVQVGTPSVSIGKRGQATILPVAQG